MKLLKILLILTIPVSLYSQNGNEENRGVRTVVIDPGHGGKDPGAVGSKVYEKKINLAVSLRLGQLIEEWFPDVKVLYTRTEDVLVNLKDRSNFANVNNADLFISIHANSIDNEKNRNTVSGSETYIMGIHKSEDNLKVAMFENSSIKYEEDYESRYDRFDPESPESYIIFSLIQHEYMEQSLKMAEFIQEEFQNGPVTRDRGVKQDGFLVLWRTAAPSVLIELGYLSHPEEELVLMDEDNQQKMAECILKAFKRYKEYTEGYAVEENE
ncbi:MAG: N-acetylmuramoyl-L-alanine amidase [Prevotellaceae bacterium]|jgi:N-acetylmuramoyl-L-alanine amidase|nr:N-acetylmuramoyl-L-alanine amidase [Prevotellaceae bacterium]